MKNWVYLTIVAFLSSGFLSCSDDEDYSSEFEELKKMEEESASKLDDLTKAQEDLKKKQEALNKQQEELAKLQQELKKLQEELGQQGAGAQDSTAAGQTQLLAEIKRMESELETKLDELAKAQEAIQKLQEELAQQGAATQDTTASVAQDQLLDEIKKMEESLAAKMDELAKAQEEIKKLQEELGKKENDEENPTDTTTTVVTPGEVFNKYDNPKWKAVEAEGDYAYSMTVVFELPAALKDSATSNDVIAAFVGEECRAVAKLSNGVFFLDVIGTGEEENPVTFRYWNAGNHYLYESLISLPFTSDFIYGVVDNPKKFSCKQK